MPGRAILEAMPAAKVPAAPTPEAKYRNRALPKRAGSLANAGFGAYGGAFGAAEAAHLLRRTLFGVRQSEIAEAVGKGLDGILDILLDLPEGDPPHPQNVNPDEKAQGGAAVGEPWVDAPFHAGLNYRRQQGHKAWWVGLMASPAISLREKMTLFWHNHFATESEEITQARYVYQQNRLLRKHCLGNFKELVKQVTLDPGMLKYLSGDTNTKTQPNENYGRELQELFTIGKGPEVGPGNYTNYTEQDVRAAARVLTGISIKPDGTAHQFRADLHDTGDKTFSSAYGGVVVKGRSGADGLLELDDLLDKVLFAQKETARYICRKLYRFFVYYVIDAEVEKEIIAPMADLFFSNWEIKPVVRALLKSAHFFEAKVRGCQIKSPLDLVVGSARQLEILPDPSAAGEEALRRRYAAWYGLRTQAAAMQMDPLDPPGVAGWPAYHQHPVYQQAWISSDTLPKRQRYGDWLSTPQGMLVDAGQPTEIRLAADPVALAKKFGKPQEADALIRDFAGWLLPLPPDDTFLAELREALLPGLGAEAGKEWAKAWSEYEAAPGDAGKQRAVSGPLFALLRALLQSSEYQLN